LPGNRLAIQTGKPLPELHRPFRMARTPAGSAFAGEGQGVLVQELTGTEKTTSWVLIGYSATAATRGINPPVPPSHPPCPKLPPSLHSVRSYAAGCRFGSYSLPLWRFPKKALPRVQGLKSQGKRTRRGGSPRRSCGCRARRRRARPTGSAERR
jgi:hypothetical protein